MLKCPNLFEWKDKIILLGEILRPVSYPHISINLEYKLTPFRSWRTDIDGYDVCIQYTEIILNGNILRNIQIYSINLFSSLLIIVLSLNFVYPLFVFKYNIPVKQLTPASVSI